VSAGGLDDPALVDEGANYFVLGPVSGTVGLEDSDAGVRGEQDFDIAGFKLAAAGNLDEDGFDDFLTGAYRTGGDKEFGTAYLVYGRAR